MPVYVDTLLDFGWKLGPSCHMFADTESELHAMALSIGMKRSWFQLGDNMHMPHYDLVKSKRDKAVKNGAIEIDRKQLCEMLKKYQQSKTHHQCKITTSTSFKEN